MPKLSRAELLVKFFALHDSLEKRLVGPLSCHGISLTEYLVLRVLNQAVDRKLRRVDLAQQVGLSASGVTRLLNPMQKIGLIRKEEVAHDARVSLVTLTAAGAKIFREASVTFDQATHAFLEPITGKDEEYLLRVMDKLRAA